MGYRQNRASDLDIFKFGTNAATVAGDAMWAYSAVLPVETAAATLYISSDNQAADVGISITVQYIDANGAQKEATTDLHATDARTFVSIGDTGVWVNRAWVSSNGDNLTGNVYISKDNTDVGGNGIPDTVTDIMGYIGAGVNQTSQAFYKVPNELGGRPITGALLHSWSADVAKTGTGWATYAVRKKEPGGSFRTIEEKCSMVGGNAQTNWRRGQYIPAGTIVYIEAETVSASLWGSAQFDIELVP